MKDYTTGRDGWAEGEPTRLRELRPGELGDAAGWAVDLLRDPPAHRLKPGERQRVLLGLGRARGATRRPWAVRLAATVAVLVAATAIARAGLGHFPRWLTALAHGPRPAPQVHVRPVASVMRRQEPPAAPDILPPPPPAPAVTPAGQAPAMASVSRPPRRPPVPAERREGDAGLVVQAMRALRRDGDAALARALCATYLQRHPSGALAEEALALTIEAAVAQHEPDAPALGARYLRQYPNGPFQGLARQATRAPGAAPR